MKIEFDRELFNQLERLPNKGIKRYYEWLGEHIWDNQDDFSNESVNLMTTTFFTMEGNHYETE